MLLLDTNCMSFVQQVYRIWGLYGASRASEYRMYYPSSVNYFPFRGDVLHEADHRNFMVLVISSSNGTNSLELVQQLKTLNLKKVSV